MDFQNWYGPNIFLSLSVAQPSAGRNTKGCFFVGGKLRKEEQCQKTEFISHFISLTCLISIHTWLLAVWDRVLCPGFPISAETHSFISFIVHNFTIFPSAKPFSLRLCGHPHYFKDIEHFHPLFGSALNSKSCWAPHVSKWVDDVKIKTHEVTMPTGISLFKDLF